MEESIEEIIDVKKPEWPLIEIIKETAFHKVGEILDVNPDFAKNLISDGIAKESNFEDYKKFRQKELKKMFLKAIETTKKQEKKVSCTGLKIDNYLDNARAFYAEQPFFYDDSGIWWIWKENRWKITDEVELERQLDNRLGFMGQTVTAGIRSNHLHAMMWVGREQRPKEAKKKWIQFNDKAFSIFSKKVHSVTKDYFFTNPIPWELGNSEDTPIIDKLFEEWVGKDYVKSLYQIIAYCCYADYPIQTLICLFGAGRNGKTCFLRLLSKFLGKDNVCSTELDSLLDSRFESFKLFRKLCCLMGETNFGVLDKSSMLKKLTGSDMIGFEKKGKDPFNDYSYAKLIIASNSLPSSNDTSDGFYRRWFIIDFPNEFKEGKDVIATVPEVEYSNLALKCMNLLPDLLDKGEFDKQGTIPERRTKYILSSNPLPLFIEQYCIRDGTLFVSFNELYTNYVTYLSKFKKRIVKNKEFREALTHEGFFVERTSKLIGTEYKNGYYVFGIKVKDDFMQIMKVIQKSTIGNSMYPSHFKNDTQLTQFTQNQEINLSDIEEVIIGWNEKQKVRLKCTIEDCDERECNFDSKGVPYCREHFNEMSL